MPQARKRKAAPKKAVEPKAENPSPKDAANTDDSVVESASTPEDTGVLPTEGDPAAARWGIVQAMIDAAAAVGWEPDGGTIMHWSGLSDAIFDPSKVVLVSPMGAEGAQMLRQVADQMDLSRGAQIVNPGLDAALRDASQNAGKDSDETGGTP